MRSVLQTHGDRRPRFGPIVSLVICRLMDIILSAIFVPGEHLHVHTLYSSESPLEAANPKTPIDVVRNRKEPTMNRMHPTPGREPMVRSASTSDRRAHRGPRRRSAWVALGALALGMVLGASPVAALPSPPAAGFGGSL